MSRIFIEPQYVNFQQELIEAPASIKVIETFTATIDGTVTIKNLTLSQIDGQSSCIVIFL